MTAQQTAEPAAEKVLAGQGVQLDCPREEAKVPAAQFEHDVAPGEIYCPTLHIGNDIMKMPLPPEPEILQ